ncbi:MAG: hypothetical protein Q8L24_01200 [bacterium]|nr:hypothetical protein [bacterium]
MGFLTVVGSVVVGFIAVWMVQRLKAASLNPQNQARGILSGLYMSAGPIAGIVLWAVFIGHLRSHKLACVDWRVWLAGSILILVTVEMPFGLWVYMKEYRKKNSDSA